MLIKKILTDEKGSAWVELAVLLPLLLMIVFGYLSYTNAIRDDLVLQMAAREGAREYSTSNSISKTKSVAKDILKSGGIQPDLIIIETKEIVRSAKEIERIVTVKKPVKFYIPAIGEYDISLKRGAMFYAEK